MENTQDESESCGRHWMAVIRTLETRDNAKNSSPLLCRVYACFISYIVFDDDAYVSYGLSQSQHETKGTPLRRHFLMSYIFAWTCLDDRTRLVLTIMLDLILESFDV